MNRLWGVSVLLVLFVLAGSIATAHSGSYEHNAEHRLDREEKYDYDPYPRYYGDGYSHNYEYEIHYDDDYYLNDYYWDSRDSSGYWRNYWKEVYDTDDFGDYEDFYWFKKNREYEFERFLDWFEDEHPWFDMDDDDWDDYLEEWWEDHWGSYIYSRSEGYADWYESDYYNYGYSYGCDPYHSDSCRDRVTVYVDRYDDWDDYYRYSDYYSRCGYKYDYYDSYCREWRSYDWCNDGYYARKYHDQVWYVRACGRVLE